jgi:hypothetical protein
MKHDQPKRLGRFRYVPWRRYIWVCMFMDFSTVGLLVWWFWLRATGADNPPGFDRWVNQFSDAIDECAEILSMVIEKNGEVSK